MKINHKLYISSLLINIIMKKRKTKGSLKVSPDWGQRSKFCVLIFILLVSLGGVGGVDAYNFTDDFSDSSKISSMSRLNLDTNITLAHPMNNTNDTNYLLLYSELGNDGEILNPIIGHAGNSCYYWREFNDTFHYDYDSKMVAWWNFTIDANDSSGNANHGTVHNATHVGEHYEFNGSTDYIEIPDSTGSLNLSNNPSISMWIKPNTNSQTSRLYNSRCYADYFKLNSGRLCWILNNNSNDWDICTVNAGDALSADSWYHVAGSFDFVSKNISLYINGDLKKECNLDLSGDLGTCPPATNYAILGTNWGKNAEFFNGSMDEVAIYNRSLSASEILGLYQNTSPLYNISLTNYTSGHVGNGSYLNATSNLTFSGQDFYASKGTIDFWASFSNWSVNSNQYFFYTKDDAGNYIRIWNPSWRGGRIVFTFVSNLGGSVHVGCKSISEFDANSWHHFVFTWDINADYMECFVDNQSNNIGTYYFNELNDESDWGSVFNTFNPSRLYIGRSSGTGYELNGTIDELRILNETYWPISYPSKEIILESVAFDTSVSWPIFGDISWTEDLPDKTDIEFQTSVSDDNITWTNWTGLSKGLVTLTFDDGTLDHYTNASTNMTPFGYEGVAYIMSNSIGGSHMNLTQLLQLQNSGWEIGGHTKTHPDLTSLNRSGLITQINDSYRDLTNLGLTQKHFAYPGGRFNLDVIDVLSDYYSTGRTILRGYNTYDRKYGLKIQSGSDDVLSIKGYIDKVANDSSWLILMFHKVGTSSGINMSDFNEILSYLNTSDVDVVTIDEALGNLSTYTTSTGSLITAPNKRYIKYRAIIHSYNGSNTPTLDDIKIQYLPMNISTTGFSGLTTNFFDVANLSNISNMILEKSSYGKIDFSDSIELNISKNYSLDTYINISDNYISINSTALSELNKSATLTLYNLAYTNPQILRDGAVCPSSICTEVSYTSDGNFTFTVTSFSTYSARETPTTTTPETTSQGGGGYITYKPTKEQLEGGYEKTLRKNWKIQFEFNNETHIIKLDNIFNKSIMITVSSEPVTFNLTVNETRKLNLDEDEYYDLQIFLEDISNNKADLIVKLIHEEIPKCQPDWECSEWSECINGKQTRICADLNSCDIIEGKPEEVKSGEAEAKWWLWLALGMAVVVIAIILIVRHKKTLSAT